MKAIIFKGPLYEKVWGSSYFKDVLNITDNPLMGELWSLSGYQGKSSTCINDEFEGKTLDDIYKNHKDLFGSDIPDEFPILVKLIATNAPLSVQVHPNDDYAKKYENSFGKTEGWLILDHKDDSTIVLGHNAKNKDEFVKMINDKKWNELLKTVKVNNGEFYPIPSGTIHALGSGIVLLEIQQSSDVTYRLYDYDRLGLDGKLRELHLDKAIDVTSYNKYDQEIKNVYNSTDNVVWDNSYFTCTKETIDGFKDINTSDYYLIGSVVSNNLVIDGYNCNIGTSFIIPVNSSCHIEGKGTIIFTKGK